MSRNIAVVAAHPDDEVLGCGGTIAWHTQKGDRVSVLILAEGLTSRDDRRERGARAEELGHLANAARQAGSILGVDEVSLRAFPDNRMDGVELLDVVKEVETWLEQTRPSVVYTHHLGDVNVDHTVVHRAVITACRPLPGYFVDELLFFETPSSTEWQPHGSAIPFHPNRYVEVTDTLERKLAALNAYRSEMRQWPHSRSLDAVRSLACWRGATVGVKAAEAFVTGRQIVRQEI